MYDFDYIFTIPERPEEIAWEPPTYDPPDMTVDKAVVTEINGLWYVKGYRDGAEVSTQGGWETCDEHVNAVLYNAEGNEVEHEVSLPLTDTEALTLAVMELAELAGVSLEALSEPVRELLSERAESAMRVVDERRLLNDVVVKKGG